MPVTFGVHRVRRWEVRLGDSYTLVEQLESSTTICKTDKELQYRDKQSDGTFKHFKSDKNNVNNNHVASVCCNVVLVQSQEENKTIC